MLYQLVHRHTANIAVITSGVKDLTVSRAVSSRGRHKFAHQGNFESVSILGIQIHNLESSAIHDGYRVSVSTIPSKRLDGTSQNSESCRDVLCFAQKQSSDFFNAH